MCGRFGLGLARAVILRAVRDENPDLDLDLDEWIDEEAFHPRYNIAPRSRSPVIRRRNRYDDHFDAAAEGAGTTTETETDKNLGGTVMHTMKWGLVPHWSKHEDTNLNTINAKGENLTDGGGMWAGIKGRKRCVVVCQGYYEWQKKGKERTPHFTRHKDGKLMLLAGLYDSVVLEGEKEPLYTFTIVTTDANKQLSWLHDRMPVILSTPAQIRTWLDTSSQKWAPEAAKVIRPFVAPNKEHDLETYPVPKEVGKVGSESPTFIEPISKRKDGIEAMFKKQKGEKSEKKEEGEVSLKGKQEESKKPASKGKKPPSTHLKRKRGSPEPLHKEGGREGSVELVAKDEKASNTKKTRMASKKEEPQPANTDEPNLSSQASSTSPRKSRKKSKPMSAPEQASPSSKKITSFFAKS